MLTQRNLASKRTSLHRDLGLPARRRPAPRAAGVPHHGLFVAINCVLANGTGMIFLAASTPAPCSAASPAPPCSWACRPTTRACWPSPASTRERCAGMRLFVSGSAPLLAATHDEFRGRTGHAHPRALRHDRDVDDHLEPARRRAPRGHRGLAAARRRACGSSTETGARAARRARSAASRCAGPTSSPATGACRRRPPRSSPPTASSAPATGRPDRQRRLPHLVGRVQGPHHLRRATTSIRRRSRRRSTSSRRRRRAP